MIASLHFAVSEEVVLEERLRALKDMGYRRAGTAHDMATFTHRGGVLDVFPWGFTFPVRIDFMDNTVESIHSFDPDSGKLLEPHQMVVLVPTTERLSHKKLKKLNWQWGQKPVQPFVDLHKGDFVVHVSHGIGKFKGMEKMKTAQGKMEQHLVLEYKDDERLLVPLDELYLVQRYVAPGIALSKVKLSKLGSKAWVKLREKAQKGVLSYAKELLELQAKREMQQGFSFTGDHEWESSLREGFGFEETRDQANAISDVKADMEKTKPMDRLICGDVGYGKTEVAVRAVFKAVMSGKQAAILVPTTLLAEQHYETFKARFKDFPVSIEMLSRFQTKSHQLQIVKRMQEGECDLVIGTHRLLSDDIAFKDLGLVVIDEEQRFGVKHKEKLKAYRLLVDVLTMTATPIPRTLYMSLVGGKDMSVVNTPPTNRVPIHTQVIPYQKSIIRDGIERELKRQGQVFFVHNRVNGIEYIAKEVQHLVPHARLAVAHGQMDAHTLEDVMHKFIHHEIDVLVATTIIESGIDIPNANTIFINRADAFGLAELYQLRGRVGRYNREAYAYLLLPHQRDLSHESQKRLNAIERHTHLGSGFSLAMEDLEIRGTGNLLGTQQSGYVGAVGFDLYCRLLQDAIQSLS